MAEDLVHIAHQGCPCDPPIVDGVEFKPLDDSSGLWVGAATEEQAAHITRIPSFNRFGGVPPPAPVPPLAPPAGDPLAGVEPPPTDSIPADAGDVPPPPSDETTDPVGDDGSEGEGEGTDPTDDDASGDESTDTTGNKYPAKKKKRR